LASAGSGHDSVVADDVLREHQAKRLLRRRARTDRSSASFEVVHDADGGTWSVLSDDAATRWGVGDALTAELIAREHLATADHDLAGRVSYDSEGSMLCIICESRADANLTVSLLKSWRSES
jgi:hypothetical protein